MSHPNNRVQNVIVRVVSKLPHGLIMKASLFRAHKVIFDFGRGRGLKPQPLTSWVPFNDASVGRLASTLVDRFCTLTALAQTTGPIAQPIPSSFVLSSPSVEPLVFEDNSSLRGTSVSRRTDRLERRAAAGGRAMRLSQVLSFRLRKEPSRVLCHKSGNNW